MEAELRVCLVPNLLTAPVFCALSSAELSVFDSLLVSSMVSHVFEHHAGKIAMVRSIIGLWALLLLMLHSWCTRFLDEEETN